MFMDVMHHELIHPLKHLEHCYIFDASEPNQVSEAIEVAKQFLMNDAERIKISQNGYEYVKKYHRPINRVKYMLWKSGMIGL